MDSNLKIRMNFLKRKVMRILCGKIIGIPDPIHESDRPLGEIFRPSWTVNVQGSSDGFSDFNGNFSSNGMTDKPHPLR